MFDFHALNKEYYTLFKLHSGLNDNLKNQKILPSGIFLIIQVEPWTHADVPCNLGGV